MMPTIRREIEVLLDSPDQCDHVGSAWADMTVKSGFARDGDRDRVFLNSGAIRARRAWTSARTRDRSPGAQAPSAWWR